MAKPRLRDLRGPARRDFLRWISAAGAAIALDRSRLLDYLSSEGGVALADELHCRTTNRSVHLVGGNGSFAWFQLLWPHVEIAKANDPTFAYHATAAETLFPNDIVPGDHDRPFAYSPEAPWVQGGVVQRKMTALMAGKDETNTQTPTTTNTVGTDIAMTAAVAAIQRATPSFLPVVGVGSVELGNAPGVPALAHAASGPEMAHVFASEASRLTLQSEENRGLFESYYGSILKLREGARRPTWTRHVAITTKAVQSLGQNLLQQLEPHQEDLDAYGIGRFAPEITSSAKDKLSRLGHALITTARAFKLGLTNSVIIALSEAGISDTTFTGANTVFGDLPHLQGTLAVFGKMLNAFYEELALAPDDTCPGTAIDRSVILTVHGDTPHTPLQSTGWPFATPDGCNWVYVMGAGYLATGWFGGVKPNGVVFGFDPTTGEDLPGQKSENTSTCAGAAIAYAVAKGNMNRVRDFYSGPDISALVKLPPA